MLSYSKPDAKLQSRAGFTLVELLVVIGIIALLISILLPTLSRARESAKTISCASQARQLGFASFSFANDNNQQLPWGLSSDRADWGIGNQTTTPYSYGTMRTQLGQFLGNDIEELYTSGDQAPAGVEGGVWECPSTDSLLVGMNGHYGWNYVAMPSQLDEINIPASLGTPVAPGDQMSPAKLNRLFGSETAMYWDQPGFAGSRVIRDNGTMVVYRAWNGMDYFNLLDPSLPELRFWTDPEFDINQGDADLGPEFPVSIVDAPNVGLSQYGKEQYSPTGSVYVIMFGAPQFRHGQADRVNVTWSDGSVRAVKGFQRQRHPVDEVNFGTSELDRRNIRIKWPSKYIDPDN